jgi:hypothetical protein
MTDIARPEKGNTIQAVFDNSEQHCLGHILARGKLGFEAFDADDKSLGLFSSSKDAAARLMVRP